jgi:CheY-like chemotaxis protein
MKPGTHVVQFHEHQEQFRKGIQAFVGRALMERQPCVMIARRSTFDGVRSSLGDSLDTVRFVDADATLDGIMHGSVPDTAAFESGLSRLWDEMKPPGNGALWICGEVVDLLCAAGNGDAAIQIEEVGQRMVATLPVAILCGYAFEHFDAPVDATRLHAVCQQHTDVMLIGANGHAADQAPPADGKPILEAPARAFGLLQRYGSVSAAYALGGPTVVVIEDDASVRRSIERTLRLHDLRVRSCVSAEDFLGEIDTMMTGCLILDIQLPGMSGLDLQRLLASSGVEIPIIAMSGSANASLERETRRLGARVFLRKPFEPDVLMSAVLSALGPRRWLI